MLGHVLDRSHKSSTCREVAIHAGVIYIRTIFLFDRVMGDSTKFICVIKTHNSVLCGPRKWGVCKRSEHIVRNNKVANLTNP